MCLNLAHSSNEDKGLSSPLEQPQGVPNLVGKARFTLGVRAPKNLGLILSIFGLVIGPKLLINSGTLAPRVAYWPSKFDGILFSRLGPIQAHKAQHLLILRGRLKSFFFPISALTLNVKPLGPISTFAPIGMLDLG